MATVASHENLGAFTLAILSGDGGPRGLVAAQSANREDSTASEASALAAVESLLASTSEIRGAAILGPASVLAASGGQSRWEEAGQALLDAADRAAGAPATHAHVATEEGEVFAIRAGELAMIAVASRFALASLVFADMRAAFRRALVSNVAAATKRAA